MKKPVEMQLIPAGHKCQLPLAMILPYHPHYSLLAAITRDRHQEAVVNFMVMSSVVCAQACHSKIPGFTHYPSPQMNMVMGFNLDPGVHVSYRPAHFDTQGASVLNPLT